MPLITDMLEQLKSGDMHNRFIGLYGDNEAVLGAQKERYGQLIQTYVDKYGEADVELFSSPGRSEISGNHTDHNLGKVLTASINMDCIGVASKRDDNKVGITSLTYNEDFVLDLDKFGEEQEGSGTYTLVLGILEGFMKRGYTIGGFNVVITSDVISAAGVSSSASFEMLMCEIVNYFYNNNEMDVVTRAKIGQYAENIKWDKQSGLLDQMACGYGGLITIDFKDQENPVIQPLQFDAINKDYDLLIVPTGANHADLSEEYSSIPTEMKAVAQQLGAKVLGELTIEDVLAHVERLRATAGDRAVLRALHFFEENGRVDRQVQALSEGDAETFLKLVTESGNSSWKWLQNCYSNTNPDEQGVTVHLALSELFIRRNGAGACRVHGGGFAGVIMVMLPKTLTEAYEQYMKDFGVDKIYKVQIRKYGAVHVGSLPV